MKIFPVLLAGGSGTRLWPVSRELYPKQLVKFIENNSLIQNTIHRLEPILEKENVRVVCGLEHYHEIARHMEDIGIPPKGKVLSEPVGRNTAPAILLAVLDILSQEEDAVVCVFPADHVIERTQQFHEKLKSAIRLAQQGHIVTFGIKPHYPETGYGYIEGEMPLAEGALSLKRFVEKPDREKAIAYLKAGTFFWNSGMFTFKASVMLKEFNTHQKSLLEKLRHVYKKGSGIDKLAYETLENISIDYAIMEKTHSGVVLPSDFGWSDIGSWKSLYDFLPRDGKENVVEGDVILKKTRRCFILGRDRLIATNNIKDMVIVETPDAVFISDLETSRDVKSIVEDLKDRGRNEHIHHPTIHYAWGKKTRLENKKNYGVSRIVVYPHRTYECQINTDEVGLFCVTEGSLFLEKSEETSNLTPGDQVRLEAADKGLLKNESDQPVTLIHTKLNL